MSKTSFNPTITNVLPQADSWKTSPFGPYSDQAILEADGSNNASKLNAEGTPQYAGQETINDDTFYVYTQRISQESTTGQRVREQGDPAAWGGHATTHWSTANVKVELPKTASAAQQEAGVILRFLNAQGEQMGKDVVFPKQ